MRYLQDEEARKAMALLLDEGAREATEIISNEKPIMHTYVDRSEPYLDVELLDLWSDAWNNAGWDIKILTLSDAMKHPEYQDYKKLLDEARICCLPRQTYLRHLAMGCSDEGGFFSEVYVFPLHKLSDISDGNDIIKGKLPNDGVMTSYDGAIGSAFSGTKDEYDRLTTVLMSKLDKNAVLSLQEIKFDGKSDIFFQKDEMYENFKSFSTDVCERAKDKFIIRFHTHEVNKYGFEEQARAFLVKKWLKYYHSLCLNDSGDSDSNVSDSNQEINRNSTQN